MRNIDNIGTPVNFSYDSAGNLVSTEVGGGSNPETHVSILYDDLGRKTELNDPNTGELMWVSNRSSWCAWRNKFNRIREWCSKRAQL